MSDFLSSAAFPMGLPDYDPINTLTKDDQGAKGKYPLRKDKYELHHESTHNIPLGTETNMAGMDQDLMDPDTSTLWWAGKEFHR